MLKRKTPSSLLHKRRVISSNYQKCCSNNYAAL